MVGSIHYWVNPETWHAWIDPGLDDPETDPTETYQTQIDPVLD